MTLIKSPRAFFCSLGGAAQRLHSWLQPQRKGELYPPRDSHLFSGILYPSACQNGTGGESTSLPQWSGRVTLSKATRGIHRSGVSHWDTKQRSNDYWGFWSLPVAYYRQAAAEILFHFGLNLTAIAVQEGEYEIQNCVTSKGQVLLKQWDRSELVTSAYSIYSPFLPSIKSLLLLLLLLLGCLLGWHECASHRQDHAETDAGKEVEELSAHNTYHVWQRVSGRCHKNVCENLRMSKI